MGTLDAACDHIGQSKWMAEMAWTGQTGYLAAPTEDWNVNGELAGTVKTFGDLTVSFWVKTILKRFKLLKIYGAGHLVPTDRPEVSCGAFSVKFPRLTHSTAIARYVE